MRRLGFAWVLAALASGCLDTPSSGGTGDGDDGEPPDEDARPADIQFPPPGAVIHASAALAADIDQDTREDLVVLDDDATDEWMGLYVLRAGEAGWAALDQVELEFRPTAVRYGRMIKAGGAALVVGGSAGEIAVVDYKPDDGSYVVDLLQFDVALGGTISIVHTGVAVAGDTRASLIAYDGSFLWQSSPIEVGATMTLTMLDQDIVFLAAAFWPLRATDPMLYVAARTPVDIRWYRTGFEPGLAGATALKAGFLLLEPDLCGTHLAVAGTGEIEGGSIACDGSVAVSEPVVGATLVAIGHISAGDLGGGPQHDVVLVGQVGDDQAWQLLLDVDYDSGMFSPAYVTPQVPVEGVPSGIVHLTPVDSERDGSALVYGIGIDGALTCIQLVDTAIEPCGAGWRIRGP